MLDNMNTSKFGDVSYCTKKDIFKEDFNIGRYDLYVEYKDKAEIDDIVDNRIIELSLISTSLIAFAVINLC